MAHIEKTVLIDAPLETVFQYATNVRRVIEWWPALIEVRNYAQEQAVPGLKYEFSYKMMGIKIDGTSEILEVVKNQLVRVRSDGGITSIIEYRFAEVEGKTRFTTTHDYTLPGSFLGKIADKLLLERVNERESENILANLKVICEGMAKSAAKK